MVLDPRAAELFPEPCPTRNGALGMVEPAVHWYTTITREEAVGSRATLNRWYADFPDPDGALAARLRSETDSEHFQAIDELVVHHILRQRWSDVRYEENGAGPDFRVYESGRYRGGIEVASIFEREDWSDEQRRYGRLADALNDKIKPTAGYGLRLEIKGDGEPTVRKFVAFLTRLLAELPDPDNSPPIESLDDCRTEVYAEDAVRVRVTFLPMAPGSNRRHDPDSQLVVMGPMIGGYGNTAERIRDRVYAKAGGRYQLNDAPFLIAVGLSMPLFQTDHDMVTALYGTEAVNIGSGTTFHRNDGVFGFDPHELDGRSQRVSAVAFLQQVRLWRPDEIAVSVMVNPYPLHEWPPELLSATRWFGQVGETAGKMQFDWCDVPGSATHEEATIEL
jgi:hypothetical protein